MVIEKPLPNCDLCELKFISSWELLERYRNTCGLPTLSGLLNNAIRSAIAEFPQYEPKAETVKVKLTDYSGSVEVIVNMDELPESTDGYLEKMAKQIRDYLKLGNKA